jgi:hypothetical protein
MTYVRVFVLLRLSDDAASISFVAQLGMLTVNDRHRCILTANMGTQTW